MLEIVLFKKKSSVEVVDCEKTQIINTMLTFCLIN